MDVDMVFVAWPDRITRAAVAVDLEVATVGNVAALCRDDWRLPRGGRWTLAFCNVVLDEGRTLKSYGIKAGAELALVNIGGSV